MFKLQPWTVGLFVLGLAVAPSTRAAEEKAETEKVKIGPVTYHVPKTWQRQNPTSSMRVAQFGVPLVEGDKGKVEFLVFYFNGGGGDADSNIKRWVGMFEDVEGKEKVKTSEVSGLKITSLDVTGTYKDKPFPMSETFTPRKDYRMMAAVIETPDDGPYFFRFVGPAKSMAAQSENWSHLLKTASLEK